MAPEVSVGVKGVLTSTHQSAVAKLVIGSGTEYFDTVAPSESTWVLYLDQSDVAFRVFLPKHGSAVNESRFRAHP